MSEADWLQAHNAWSKRALAAEAKVDALVAELKMARARIEYLGAACINPKHFDNNAEVVLPRIDRVLDAVGTPLAPEGRK